MGPIELEALGRDWATWLGHANLWGAATLAVVFFLDRLLARHVSAGWRMALYALVLVRVLAPEGLATPWGLLPGADASGGGYATATTETIASVPGGLSGSVATAAGPGVAPSWSWGTAVLVVHALGTLALLARLLVGVRTLQTIRRSASALQLPNPTAHRLVEHPTAGPLAMGILRPTIVLPTAALALHPDELAAIVRHEAAHLRHRDPALQTLNGLACALAWPVAALWLAASRLRVLMEVRADDAATHPLDRRATRQYGELLLRVASVGGIGPIAVGLGHAHLRARLGALGRRPATSAVTQGLAVALAGATCVAVVARRQSEPEAAESVVATPAVVTEACGLDRGWQRPDDESAPVAEARWKKGLARMEAGDVDGAIKELREAAWLAASIKYDDLAAAATTQLVLAHELRGEDNDALAWAPHASAAFRRVAPSREQVLFHQRHAELLARTGNADGAARERAQADTLLATCGP